MLLICFAFVLGIGWALKHYMRTSTDFFLSGRSVPAWITGLAFLSANLGAQEVVGMGASGARYGMLTSHFYFAAISSMVFVGVFMMPFYYDSQRSRQARDLNREHGARPGVTSAGQPRIRWGRLDRHDPNLIFW